MSKPVLGFFALYYDPPLGGAERSMENYFNRLKDHYDIHVYCFMRDNMKFHMKEEFFKNGIHIIRTHQPIDMAVRAFISTYKPDLIATQLLGSDLVVNESFKYNVPCVYFAHGMFEDICFGYLRQDCPYDDVLTCPHGPDCPYGDDLARHLNKYTKCEYIICNSEYTKKSFEKVFPEILRKLKIIPPDFNYDLFKYKKTRNKDKIKILAVNSSVLKGRDLIYDIAYNNQDLHFIYVDCRIPDWNFLERSPNIHVLGKVERERLAEIYREVNVTVIPTVLQETFSGVACESILSGTPVISTSKGNLRSLVRQGDTGYIIDALDPKEWEETIRIAARDVIDENSSDIIRSSLDSESNAKKICKIFDSIIDIKQRESDFVAKEKFISVDKQKIMFFAKFFYPPLGGGEYFIHSVLTHLKEKGYQCEGACYCHPDPRMMFGNRILDWRGIKVHQFGAISYDMICDFFEIHKPDLVITQSYDAPDIIRAAKSKGIKTILGTHFWRNICEVEDNFVNMLERPLSSVKIRRDLQKVFGEADSLYVNSEYMQKAVKRFVGIDIERVINPILDKDRVISKDYDKKYITIVNPDVGKGGRLFVELAKMMPDDNFMCIGFGNECSRENSIINNEIRNIPNVKTVEQTDNMADVYKETSILIVPSLVDETFSMVCLEAMANGIPVIVSKYGNLPFLAGENSGGFVLDPIDTFVWKETIEKLKDKELYNSYSARILSRSKAFDPQIQLREFEKMIEGCIGD